MEESEGNKERNVVKVLAKRPSQSTETEVRTNHYELTPPDLVFTELKNTFNVLIVMQKSTKFHLPLFKIFTMNSGVR